MMAKGMINLKSRKIYMLMATKRKNRRGYTVSVSSVTYFYKGEGHMKLLVLDGNSILNRAFYGIRLLSNKNGVFTNAVYGFMNILIKLKESEHPDVIAAAFDLKAPTFRHEMYDGYKAGRKPMPPELFVQLPIIKKVLGLCGVVVLEKEGYEADDILGTLSLSAKEKGWDCVISTGDRDSLQLVDEKTRVLLASTKAGSPELKDYTVDRIKEEYGVEPRALIDIKALAGDSSDNIPGVAGVGPKTAGALIGQFGSLDGVYENIDSPDIRETLRAKLIKDKDNAYLSLKLGEICRNVPIQSDPHQLCRSAVCDPGRLVGELSRLELFKIIERLGLKNTAPVFDDIGEQTQKDSVPESEIAKITRITPDEISAVGEKTGGLLFLSSFKTEDGVRFAAASGDKGFLFSSDETELLKALSDSDMCAVSCDMKAMYRASLQQKSGDFDLSLAAYLLNSSAASYELERLMTEYSCPAGVIGEGDFSEFDEEEKRAVCEASAIQRLYKKLSSELEKTGQYDLFYNIEMPLCNVLADMERTGFSVDKEALLVFGETLKVQIEELCEKIYGLVGYEFNLNSPKQLGKALFEDLMLTPKKKTKSGYSTSAEVLEELKYEHPAVELLLEYRQLSKLKSTYVDSMAAFIDENGRIHSTFNQTETRTGRISSAEPNLQNIPVRKAVGRELRRFFKAKEGCVLCDADDSQIELRVLAHMADDKTMIDTFLSGGDIHTATAAQVFGMPREAVTPLMRSRAKAVNFGIVYGIGAYSLSRDLSISFKEAKQYIDGYMATYKGVADYMERVVQQAKEDGFATTCFGRRRYLPELSAKNAALRSFGERVARNMPVQGTAADIIKIAMINVYRALKKENMKSKLILQVHDELIIEAVEEEKEKAAEILRREMENAAKLRVPLTVDIGMGDTWYDAKG